MRKSKPTKVARAEAWNPGGVVKGPSPGRGEGMNGPSKTVGGGKQAPKTKRGPAGGKGTSQAKASVPPRRTMRDFEGKQFTSKTMF